MSLTRYEKLTQDCLCPHVNNIKVYYSCFPSYSSKKTHDLEQDIRHSNVQKVKPFVRPSFILFIHFIQHTTYYYTRSLFVVSSLSLILHLKTNYQYHFNLICSQTEYSNTEESTQKGREVTIDRVSLRVLDSWLYTYISYLITYT